MINRKISPWDVGPYGVAPIVTGGTGPFGGEFGI